MTKEKETIVDVVSAETEKLNAAQRKLESSVDIEKSARAGLKEYEGEALYDDAFVLDMAKGRVGTSEKPEAQSREDAEPETPEKSDKVEGEAAKPTDGQPEGSAEIITSEDGQEAPEKTAKQDGNRKYEELRSKATKVEQENAWLRDQLAQTRDTAVKVNELSEKLKKVEPYIPLIETMTDIDDLEKTVVVPQDQWTGVNEQTQESFATDEDKVRFLAGNKKGLAYLIQKAAQREIKESDKAKVTVAAQQRQIAKEIQDTYNGGKPFEQAVVAEILKGLGDKAGILDDPTVDYETKKAFVKASALEVLQTRKGGITSEELNEHDASEALRAEKAKLLHSKSNLRPKKEMTPDQKKQAEVYAGMLKSSQRGRMVLSD
jgi:hypothetical protein